MHYVFLYSDTPGRQDVIRLNIVYALRTLTRVTPAYTTYIPSFRLGEVHAQTSHVLFVVRALAPGIGVAAMKTDAVS